MWVDLVRSRQKLGMILENEMSKNWSWKMFYQKMVSSNDISRWKKKWKNHDKTCVDLHKKELDFRRPNCDVYQSEGYNYFRSCCNSELSNEVSYLTSFSFPCAERPFLCLWPLRYPLHLLKRSGFRLFLPHWTYDHLKFI